ncbi:hypothetical protein CVT25_004982 [Psilocybe cyanescens]|uniref:Integrase catalytic domain-containing protein n=1 Tax=Psilocybe cyanescens TaxID=93625 RepID=A0A409W208_PSICY|nr:hypothetical protein CVT25_004982 [Psilocybe cyanescens]
MGEISNNLYFLHVKFLLAPGVTPTIPLEIALYTKINKMMDLWHHQMGHIREKATRNLLKFVLDVTFLLNDTFSKCKPCIISKHARPPCPLSLSPKSLELLALLFIDLCGPFPVITPHSKSYMIVFMDDCSDAIKVHLLATKDQSYDAYKKTKAAWKLKMGKKVKVIHFDPGGEFVGSEFIASLKADSIFVDIVPQGEHWKNWKMEHCMQTLQRCMLAMITAVQVTLYYWGEAALCSAFLQNIMITSSLPPNVTPFEIFHKHKLNIKFLCALLKFLWNSKLSWEPKASPPSNESDIDAEPTVAPVATAENAPCVLRKPDEQKLMEKGQKWKQTVEAAKEHLDKMRNRRELRAAVRE